MARVRGPRHRLAGTGPVTRWLALLPLSPGNQSRSDRRCSNRLRARRLRRVSRWALGGVGYHYRRRYALEADRRERSGGRDCRQPGMSFIRALHRDRLRRNHRGGIAGCWPDQQRRRPKLGNGPGWFRFRLCRWPVVSDGHGVLCRGRDSTPSQRCQWSCGGFPGRESRRRRKLGTACRRGDLRSLRWWDAELSLDRAVSRGHPSGHRHDRRCRTQLDPPGTAYGWRRYSGRLRHSLFRPRGLHRGRDRGPSPLAGSGQHIRWRAHLAVRSRLSRLAKHRRGRPGWAERAELHGRRILYRSWRGPRGLGNGTGDHVQPRQDLGPASDAATAFRQPPLGRELHSAWLRGVRIRGTGFGSNASNHSKGMRRSAGGFAFLLLSEGPAEPSPCAPGWGDRTP